MSYLQELPVALWIWFVLEDKFPQFQNIDEFLVKLLEHF